MVEIVRFRAENRCSGIEMPHSKRSAGISCSRALIEDSIEESGPVLIEEEHREESLSSLV